MFTHCLYNKISIIFISETRYQFKDEITVFHHKLKRNCKIFNKYCENLTIRFYLTSRLARKQRLEVVGTPNGVFYLLISRILTHNLNFLSLSSEIKATV